LPTYGYRCPACSNEFDVWQRMTDEPGAACPRCGAVANRQFFPAGIVFKGTGFYATDSRASSSSNGKAAAPANGSKPGQPSGTATGEAKSDTKSDTTSNSKPTPGSAD
jgi:putative FmdB family regulatory protein